MEKFAYAQAQMAVKTKALTENVEKQFKAGSLKVQVNDKVSQRNDLENRIANVVNSGGDLSKGGFANNEQYQEARKNLARLRSEIYNLGKDWRKAQDEANSSASQYNNISKTLKLEVKELQKGLVVLEAQYKKGVISGRKLNEEEKKRSECSGLRDAGSKVVKGSSAPGHHLIYSFSRVMSSGADN
ncbi:MAG: hypothetical protein E7L41_18755, partial [Escherichia coli]|nr:hypothetical protein [Escherichia coli]